MGTRRTSNDRAARRASDADLLKRRAQRSDIAQAPGGPAAGSGWIPPRRRHCWVHTALAPPAALGSDHPAVEGLVLGWRRRSDEHGEQRWFARVVITAPDYQPQVLELPASAVRGADTSAR